MLLLPIHHPLRVAQAAAMVDVLSGGRLHLGVANGYSPGDLRSFGVPPGHRGTRMTAGLELIRALFSGEAVTCSGEDFALDGFRLFPAPIQKPRPPIYVGGHAPRAVERAARLGDHFLISTTQSIDEVVRVTAIYHDALRLGGQDEKKPFLNRIVCAVSSRAEKHAAERLFGEAFLAAYDQWGHESVRPLEPRAVRHR
jgi:alkanesulfonate monooxygenase SsuD/methylene tetrahydromethanopterin reductase-like flavin-dependent oxidoreductase (luciferase family)